MAANDMIITVGEIVAADFRAADVFERYGIDFCCGGSVTLSAACGERGLDSDEVSRELAAATAVPATGEENFREWELSRLADHIVEVHHAYLNRETPRIAAYVGKIVSVHGERHPELAEVAALFGQVAGDLVGHLREEEEVLFPAVKRVDDAAKTGSRPDPDDSRLIAATMAVLGTEHQAVGDAVHEIRRLTAGYAVPADACTTFALTYRLLREFEDDLHRHVHLENNILFPRAARQ